MTAPIVVFYAYKGGTGRTTSLAVVAWALARQGHRVAAMDFDLTAPGLGPLLGAPTDLRGIVDLAVQWQGERRCSVLDAYWEVPLDAQARGNLFVVTAGRVDADYLAALQGFDWQSLVASHAVGSLFERVSFLDALAKAVRSELRPDVILIDAPTGFSDTANVVLDQLADAAVLCFAPTRIQLEGIGRVAHMLVRASCERQEAGESPRPDVLGVASLLMSRRVGTSETKRVTDAFAYLRDVRYGAFGASRQLDETTRDIVEQEPCMVIYEAALSDLDLLPTHEPMAPEVLAAVSEILPFVRERIPERVGESSAPLLFTSSERLGALERLPRAFRQFAESEAAELGEIFFLGDHTKAFHEPGTALVLGGKGAGKTALFLYATHNDPTKNRAIHGGERPQLNHDQLLAAHGNGIKLDVFWRVYVLAQAGVSLAHVNPVAQRAVNALLEFRVSSDETLLDALAEPTLPTAIHDAWLTVDRDLADDRRINLLIDGLDTAFKGDSTERERSIAALFVAWNATFSRLKNATLKVFLRQDIWDGIAFPEKSHLNVRALRIRWEPPGIWRMVFKRLLHVVRKEGMRWEGIQGAALDAETASMEVVHTHLERLFDRHIWTGKKALARNWILRRLTDGNGTIFPRDVLGLLSHAIDIERARITDRPSTNPALLSGRSLGDSLAPTSESRVSAVKEEYPEFIPVLPRLRGENARGRYRSLVDGILAGLTDAEQVAARLVRAGIVKVEEDQYEVPALYFPGLEMNRPGPR